MQKKLKELTFFFPVFNDEGTVEKMVTDALPVLRSTAEKFEILIVNDGSFDNSAKVADKMARDYPEVKVVHHLYNIGYGAALKTGFMTAKYDWIFYTDGDHQFDVNELKDLVPLSEHFDFISGYRQRRADTFSRRLSSRLYNFMVHSIFMLNFKDIDCAFKLLRKDVVNECVHYVNSGFICVEIFYYAKRKGFRIKQVPVHHYKRTGASSTSISLFFLVRSFVELFEIFWELRLKEPFYRFRQKWIAILFFRNFRRKNED